MSTIKLSEAHEAIAAAVARMLDKPYQHRPYVVVEDTVTGKFVQFCGSDREPLLFDVPALGLLGRPVEKQKDRPALVKHAAELAVNVLRGLELPDFAELKIDEGIQVDGDPS